MKVYIVECGYEYDSGEITGIFSTKEKAEMQIIKDKEIHSKYYWNTITEYEVDACVA